MINKKQLLKLKEIELLVVGKGKTINDAISDIFQKINRQIYSEFKEPIIQMETKQVYFNSVEKKERKKRVATFNNSIEIKIEALIILSVKYLDIKEEEERIL